MTTIRAGEDCVTNKWEALEIIIEGPSDNNPFTDYKTNGAFIGENETITTAGFYDGGGIYKIRFMPSYEGEYRYELDANFSDRTYAGAIKVITPRESNRGPVRVANRYHFAYADGTPYYPLGTTCYVWTHQPRELQEETLKELANGYFNKIRFCVFPKHYDYNLREPITYPYEKTPDDGGWDFTRFNPEHFRRFEKRIEDLAELGIEADIILMHPYDRWGFSDMGEVNDELYLKYVAARFAAFRNVWWSFANEYDLMKTKTTDDWERFAKIICESDPYGHPRSIHNCGEFYDHRRPWITHCSIQRQDLHKTAEFSDDWRVRYGKPVVLDEIAYEGDINHCWGNISGKELVRRFWEGAVRGGYGGHGETYKHPEDILWWSHGGALHGESQKRIKFLAGVLKETPGIGLKLYRQRSADDIFNWDDVVAVPEDDSRFGDYYLIYFGIFRPSFREYSLGGADYDVELIDTWEMTIKFLGRMRGRIRVELPGKEYMAVRIRRAYGSAE